MVAAGRRDDSGGRHDVQPTKEGDMSTTAFGQVHSSMAQQGLVRPLHGRLLAGVCTGLGRRFGLDPWPARLLFLLVLLVLPGSQLVVYVVLWIVMPAERPGQVPPAPAAAAPPTSS
jgi:phage shock protein PspC (stress-responsive transcriptional regulator)